MDPKKKLDMFDSLGLLHILGQWNPVLSVSSEKKHELVSTAKPIAAVKSVKYLESLSFIMNSGRLF